jgi:hypothetical protein
VFFGNKPDFALGLLRLLHKPPDSFKHNPKLTVILPFTIFELSGKIGMRG